MKAWESVRLAFRALAANKLRAALTMLGIIIGVGAVITLMSAGEGVSVYIEESFQGIGSNLLFVAPGSIEENRSGGVVAVAPAVTNVGVVATARRDMFGQIHGVPPEYADIRNWYTEVGTYFDESHMNSRARVAVIGKDVVEELFPDNPYPLDETIKINDVPFRIIGILETRLYPERSKSGDYLVDAIIIQASGEDRMDAASEQVAAILRDRHNIDFRDEDDFSMISQADIIAVFGEITGVLTIFLGAIAGISLLVGGIGIMNIMLVSVTERTREIGLRKAVGARRRDILWQFLVEAVALALSGGVIGIILGATGAEIISALVDGFRAIVTPDAVVLATTFSAAVGLFFGIYPARRASLLNPIDALRYE
jgi:putative ABC transport system permease protein